MASKNTCLKVETIGIQQQMAEPNQLEDLSATASDFLEVGIIRKSEVHIMNQEMKVC